MKGLFALLPIVLTVLVLYFLVDILYAYVGRPIGRGFILAMENWAGWNQVDHPVFYTYLAPVLGFAVAIVITLVFGFLVATFLGKKLFQLFEWMLKKIPVVGKIYPYAKQFIDFFFSEKRKIDFKHAVAVPFPTPGIYSIGFVTGDGMKTLNDVTGKHLLAVFVPTSPTPFTGYVCYVPREEVIPLPITAEEAMRILITAGVLHPAHQAVSSASLPGPGSQFAMPEELARALAESQGGGADPEAGKKKQ